MKLFLKSQKIKVTQLGQTLIELLVTIGLAAILMPAFLTGFATTRIARPQLDQRLQAIAYVREAEEAIRIIRDNGWTSVTNGVAVGAASSTTTYCPQQVPSGTTWELVSLTDPTKTTACDTPASGFTRSITIVNAQRNASNQIVLSGGTADPSTKAITITVSWTNPISSSVSQTLYLTRHDNLSYLDTSTTDFNNGTNNGTTVTNIYGGEVQIGGGGSSDWCKPNAAAIVKFKTSTNGNEVAISAVSSPASGSPDYAYTTFGYSANSDTLDKWSVTDPASGNPVISNGGLYNPTPHEKSYGLYATASAVLVASNKNNISVDVISPSTLSSVATYNAGGNAGVTPYAAWTSSGYTGFVTAGTNLYAFALGTNPSGTLSQYGNPVALAGTGNRVVVVKGYAFVATSSTASPLQIFKVWSPGSISAVSFSYSGNSISQYQGSSPKGATDLVVDNTGNYLYIVTSYVDSSHPDIFKIDISDVFIHASPTISIVGNQNTVVGGVGMSPNGIILVSQNHAVVVGSGGTQYQVFYTLNLGYCSTTFGPISGVTNVKAVSSVTEADGDNFAYILTDDSNNELQLIPGGEGTGSTGAGTGTFISQGLPVPNLTSNATFNRFSPVADTPLPTSITYQVGVAPTCSSSFTFIGPDGSSATTFATGSAIPILTSGGYQNPGECFKYKAVLSSGGSTTASPILYQVNVNYSP
ncbi:MAG: type II secretion system protein [Patescibacteria group bacterium]|nr:type II secretion system protein [Patescibacteria group bacterium]MDE2588238.1 type II secretion system protein [Patescibacteria group bacterium]